VRSSISAISHKLTQLSLTKPAHVDAIHSLVDALLARATYRDPHFRVLVVATAATMG
jgi:hypothetical protein